MNLLFLLYLAHFLGDYPFQSNWVYARKTTSPWIGGLWHTFGIFFALLICLAPFLEEGSLLLTIAIICVFHYVQDAFKVVISRKSKRHILGYFLDQISHLLLITLLWHVFLRQTALEPSFAEPLYANTLLIVYLIGLILVTYCFDITRAVIQLHFINNPKPFQRDWTRMLIHAVIYSLLFSLTFTLLSSS